MENTVKEIVKVYRKISAVPSVVSATLLPRNDSMLLVESIWQQSDLKRSEHIKYKKTSLVTANENRISILALVGPQEIGKDLITKYNQTGEQKAVIREVLDKDNKKVQYLEVWNQLKKIINVNLKDVDKHGDVHNNDPFGSLEWSYDNTKLLYVAERKVPKTKSYFKLDKEEDCRSGNEHLYRQSWGEQLTEVFSPTLCIFDTLSSEVSDLSAHIPSDISVGQAIWHRDNESIIFTGYPHEPYRLGIRYCPIRKSGVYLLNPKRDICRILSRANQSVRSPRLHPREDRIIFLQNPTGGPHMKCCQLVSLKLPLHDKDESEALEYNTIVDIVYDVKSPNDFPGLYLLNLPNNCWSKDGNHVFLSSNWRSHNCALAINIKDKSVKRLTSEGNCNILDVKDDVILAGYSTPSTAPHLIIAKFANKNAPDWMAIEKPCDIANVKWCVHSFKPELDNSDFPNIDCEYILYEPGKESADIGSRSLILNPHGGPHGSSSTVFSHGVSGMCQLGFTVVQINYRGSTGFGQNCIDCLPGRVGTQDVSDVHQAATIVNKDHKFDRVFVTGGSHGGFLTLHLIGQYPDYYSAACVRNPVANIAFMADLSDIPDWSRWEAGITDFNFDSITSAENYAAMLKVSPVTHIKKAKAPLLMLIGNLDLRVPPSQGRDWCKKYKALGKECKVLEYKDNNHPLNKVDADSDGFVNMIIWFKEHENKK